MFGLSIPSLYVKLAGAAVVVLAVLWHFHGDKQTKSELATVTQQLADSKAEKRQLEAQLIVVTKAKADQDTAVKVSETEREKVKAELQQTLKKMKAQKPPTDCKAAIDWAIKNRADMEYDQ